MILKVGKHRIEIQRNLINEKEINVTKCEFIFDEDITSEFVKEAYFTFEGTSYKKIITNDECDIPSEVLDKAGEVELGVVAYLVENQEEIIRYNPTPVYFTTLIGSLKENAENTEPITPSEMEQYQQALNDGLAEAQRVDIDAVKLQNVATVSVTERSGLTKSVEIYDGLKGEPGRDGVDGITPTIGDNGNWYIDTTDTGKPSRGETGAAGATGQPGRDGIDGVSPTVATSKSGTVTTIEITDKNGTHTATINDGINGSNGRDGYVQYTAGDNITIENNVISASGGSQPITTILFDNTSADNLALVNSWLSSCDFANGIIPRIVAKNSGETMYFEGTMPFKHPTVNNYTGSFWINFAYQTSNSSEPLYISSKTLSLTLSNGVATSMTWTNAYNGQMVNATSNQTISGNKEFNNLPRSSATPTLDVHLTTKKYVDDAIASAGGGGAVQEINLTAGQTKLYELSDGIYKVNATENGVYVLPRVGTMFSVPNGGFVFYILYKDTVNNVYRVGVIVYDDYIEFYKIDSSGRRVSDKKNAWQYSSVMTTGALMANNNDSYTPTGLYNPATKKYVDDSITAAITTTLGGSF